MKMTSSGNCSFCQTNRNFWNSAVSFMDIRVTTVTHTYIFIYRPQWFKLGLDQFHACELWQSGSPFSDNWLNILMEQIPMLDLSRIVYVRATSHTSQEPWPWSCESPEESVQRPCQSHLQNHVAWSRTLKCSVKSYVTGSLNNCYFNKFIFMRVFTHDEIE
jgi:hypothetical protein